MNPVDKLEADVLWCSRSDSCVDGGYHGTVILGALAAVVALRDAAREMYEEAMGAWDEDDIRPESSYAQAGGLIRARTAATLRDALAAFPAEWESHEGMVTVYRADGSYAGCMGIERWERLLREDGPKCDIHGSLAGMSAIRRRAATPDQTGEHANDG